jgi:hypothetical protein
LFGCGTCSFNPRVGHRLKVFETRVLRRIFGSKRGSNMGIKRYKMRRFIT